MALPLPAILTCRLIVKNGEPFTSCRNKTEPIEFSFEIARGFRLLTAQVETEFVRRLAGEWSNDFSIFLKPTMYAPQRDFLELDEEIYCSRISKAWDLARLRLRGQSDFVLELFVYVPRASDLRASSIRRATANRIQEQALRVAALLAGRNIQSGPASQLYMATMQARLPVDSPIEVPNNATFRQLQHIDQLSQEMKTNQQESQATADTNFGFARIQIQGAVLRVQVHVGDLRNLLGLPDYSLRPPFRDPVKFETPAPAFDMEDIDHIDEQHENV